jgi:hypothetical protein
MPTLLTIAHIKPVEIQETKVYILRTRQGDRNSIQTNAKQIAALFYIAPSSKETKVEQVNWCDSLLSSHTVAIHAWYETCSPL